jgi:GAF domain-containing protein
MSIDQPALTAAISTLREEHLQRDELDGSLRRVVEATCSLFAVAGAGLMLVDDGSRLRYVAATDGRSAALEAAQSETGEGPCVDSLLQGRVVTTEDLGADARWPRLSTIVRGLGVRAMLGVPIHVDRVTVGSLNVYSDETAVWGDEDIDALQSFAVVLEELLRQALVAQERHELAEQLDRALTNRVLIDRAVGVVMAERRTDPVTAFNVIRDRARSERRKVSSVAEELLAGVQGAGAQGADGTERSAIVPIV